MVHQSARMAERPNRPRLAESCAWALEPRSARLQQDSARFALSACRLLTAR